MRSSCNPAKHLMERIPPVGATAIRWNVIQSECDTEFERDGFPWSELDNSTGSFSTPTPNFWQ